MCISEGDLDIHIKEEPQMHQIDQGQNGEIQETVSPNFDSPLSRCDLKEEESSETAVIKQEPEACVKEETIDPEPDADAEPDAEPDAEDCCSSFQNVKEEACSESSDFYPSPGVRWRWMSPVSSRYSSFGVGWPRRSSCGKRRWLCRALLRLSSRPFGLRQAHMHFSHS
uniref:Uncharacterized protein n=1 Tax=Knipowitschia caucasica TaxID=637954 RepID=A0AAV2MAS7_KNICA